MRGCPKSKQSRTERKGIYLLPLQYKETDALIFHRYSCTTLLMRQPHRRKPRLHRYYIWFFIYNRRTPRPHRYCIWFFIYNRRTPRPHRYCIWFFIYNRRIPRLRRYCIWFFIYNRRIR